MAALLGLGALAIVVVAVVGLYVSRQRSLTRRVGSFTCLVRVEPPGDATWTAGIAHYGASELVWWRSLSLAPRPARCWTRSELTVVERESLAGTDEQGRPLLLVRCVHRGERFEMTVSEPAFAGLVSWLESGPRPVGRVV